MFEDALLESGGRIKTHRAATTFASLLMQSALVGLLLLLPLIFTEALPAARPSERIHVPASLGSRAERPTELVAVPPRRGTSEMTRENVLMAPTRIPRQVADIIDDGPPSIGLPGAGATGVTGVGPGDPNGVMNMPIGGRFVPPPAVRPPQQRLEVSDGVMRGFLLNKVMPEYPRFARMTRIQGDVVLHAIIGREGEIEGLRTVSGPPQLRAAAEVAVRQWRYRPYLLNGKPIEVETQITVRFILGSD